MDLLAGILKEHSGDLVSKLTRHAGFTDDQAERFVPEAGGAVLKSLKNGGSEVDLESPAATERSIESLLSGIDAEALASKAGISPAQSLGGLKAILPTLLGLISSKAGALGGLESLVSGGEGGAAGGMMGKLGGMLGK